MKPRGWLILVCALGLLATGPASARRRAPEGNGTEVRGLWVTRAALTSRASVEAMIRTAEAGGFNTLLVQVRGRGEAFYTSAIEPRASDLDGEPATFDPLATTLDLAHRAGLRVHAWISVNLVASAATLPQSHDHIALRHPEWLMVPKPLAGELHHVDPRSPAYIGRLARWTRSMSSTVEGLYPSPIPEASQEYTARVVSELVARYPIDGLHLDYARYPNDAFDYSAAALAAFRASRLGDVSLAQRQQLDRRAAATPTIWADMFPDHWAAFRRNRLTSLIRRVRTAAKTARPDVIVSAAVVPDADQAFNRRLQDWRGWAAAGLLDVVCPMAYTTNLADFTGLLHQAQAAAGSVPVWAGIGAWQLPWAATATYVHAAREAGTAGVLLFSYDRLAADTVVPSQYFDDLRPVLLGLNQN